MTTIEITLPDEVAQRARTEGLLSDSAIQRLVEDALRRRQVAESLLSIADRVAAAGIIPSARDADLFRPARKTFFFEKKKQKTFGYWDPRQPKAEAQ